MGRGEIINGDEGQGVGKGKKTGTVKGKEAAENLIFSQ